VNTAILSHRVDLLNGMIGEYNDLVVSLNLQSGDYDLFRELSAAILQVIAQVEVVKNMITGTVFDNLEIGAVKTAVSLLMVNSVEIFDKMYKTLKGLNDDNGTNDQSGVDDLAGTNDQTDKYYQNDRKERKVKRVKKGKRVRGK